MVPYSLCGGPVSYNGLVYMVRTLDPCKVYIGGVFAQLPGVVAKRALQDKGHNPLCCYVTREWPIGKPLESYM